MNTTPQINKWTGKFGKSYTDRNAVSIPKLDKSYRLKFGITRKEMNLDFLSKIDKNIRILEVGANIGNQLLYLQRMGFRNLFGIEPMEYAREKAKKATRDINIINGNIFDIPFKDDFFDLVFTSDVLIHIHPKDIRKAVKEIYRCTKRYIWGFEYYSPKYSEINYRGESQLLWKTDFPRVYTALFPNLRLVKTKYYKYLNDSNVDVMFLLKKGK